MQSVKLVAALLAFSVVAGAQTKAHPDKYGCDAGVKKCAAYRRDLARTEAELNLSIWPRDIFACAEKYNCLAPIRGWKMKIQNGYEFDGAMDISEFYITATHPDRETSYFWVRVSNGVDEETGISSHQIEVKQLDNLKQNPEHNYRDDLGFWSPDRRFQWIPNKDGDNLGSCIMEPHSSLPMTIGPTTKQECFDSAKNDKCSSMGEDNKVVDIPCPPYHEN